jgi:hypothetical protein
MLAVLNWEGVLDVGFTGKRGRKERRTGARTEAHGYVEDYDEMK